MNNIGNTIDEFFRYKMPTLKVQIQGSGNGIHTNIVNLDELAKAIKRPPEYICKYFGYKLGVQSREIIENLRSDSTNFIKRKHLNNLF